jgi:hypothetical protein
VVPNPFDPSAVLVAAVVPDVVVDEVVPAAVVLALVCAACRSPKRFCVPRSAPRLDVAVVAVLFTAVFVLVEAAAVEDVAAAAVEPVLPTSDFVPPPPNDPDAPRLPRSLGAIKLANRSACTTPLTRMVRSRSPDAIVAVRTTTASWGFVRAPATSRAIHAAPARHKIPARAWRVRVRTEALRS